MKTYTIDINGLPHTFQLSDEEAKARGLKPDPPKPAKKAAAKPANKSRTAQNKT